MGYRCPECKADYGYDQKAFQKHALEKHCVDTTDDLECFLWAERLSFRFDRQFNFVRGADKTKPTGTDK